MGRSAANRQGIVTEFHIVWRVVTLHICSATFALGTDMKQAYSSYSAEAPFNSDMGREE